MYRRFAIETEKGNRQAVASCLSAVFGRLALLAAESASNKHAHAGQTTEEESGSGVAVVGANVVIDATPPSIRLAVPTRP
jgi:hypothetical protein